MKKQTSANKSLFAGNRSSQKSLLTSKSKEKSIKNSESSQAVKLTNEVLHP